MASTRSHAISTEEREPLIPSPTPTLRGTPVQNYGATGGRSRSRSHGASPGEEGEGDDDGESLRKGVDPAGKVNKEFKEIWAMCLGLATAVFCSALGATIVANLQVEIGSYFRAGSMASWLGTAYLLGLAAMTPLYGRLAQVMGRKGAMLLAVSLFFGESPLAMLPLVRHCNLRDFRLSTDAAAGTLACAIAPSMLTILVARGVAGMGSGGILTVTAIIITDLVSIADRGLYQGGINVLFGAGAATGAVVGGAIADALGWRAAFWLQVPAIALAALLIVWKVDVPHTQGDTTAWEKVKRIDWAGCGMLTISIASLTVSTSLATSSGYPWTHPAVLGLLITFALTIPLFLIIEKRAFEPILPLSMLTRAQPSLILLGFVLLTAGNFSRLYMQPVYLHVTRALNGRDTGLVLLPSSIFGSASSLYAGYHMRRFREYKWFQFIVSLIPWLQALSIIFGWTPDTGVHRLWFELALGALGGGAVITTLMTSLINCVETHELSLAISACYLFRSLGQVIGVAIAAAIQQAVLSTSLSRRMGSAGASADTIRGVIQEPASVVPHLEPILRRQAQLSYLDSVDAVFVFIVVIGVGLSGICLAVRARPLK